MELSETTCIVIPTYNNEKTIKSVVESVLPYSQNVIVVNDGSTDSTTDILAQLQDKITLVSYAQNRGKGFALKTAFTEAKKHNYTYAITLDADGQHKATDLPLFAEAIAKHNDAFIIGSRQFDLPNMPAKNSFANKFSNFWFCLQTAHNLPDTQTGFRAYPLKKLNYKGPINNRYEAELEILVRSAWKNIPLFPIPIDVYYPPKEERVSHYRPTWDGVRISLLNTLLCLLAIVYGYPSMGIRKLIAKITNKKRDAEHDVSACS